jgi:transposase
MKRFVAEVDRGQWTLLPECLDDFIAESNPVRVVDAFVAALDNACRTCALKSRCTTGVQRRITRWEHEHVLEAVQRRLDANPYAMRARRTTVEHPFGTIKARMGATNFLMKRLPRVATEMALHVLAYNLTRALNIAGIKPMMAAVGA